MAQPQTSQALAWFSIGLGLTELVAPNWVSRLAGIRSQPLLIRGFGLREIGNGLAILSQPQSPNWLWARVGGDFLDMTALAGTGQRWSRVALAGAATVAITALDVAAAQRLSGEQREATGGETEVAMPRSVTINRPANELAQIWKRPESMQKIMAELGEVTMDPDGRAHWKMAGPVGTHIEFDTQIVEERPGELMRWESADDAAIRAVGEVSFTPDQFGRGTVVKLSLGFEPPAGPIGRVLALAKPITASAAGVALDRFKSLIETGSIVTSRSQPDIPGGMVSTASQANQSAASA